MKTMKRSKVPFGIGLALLLAAFSAFLAAPSSPASPAAAPAISPALAAVLGQPAVAGSTPATPVETATCGPRIYSCESCPSLAAPLKLCYKQNCGSFQVVHCDPCAPQCSLPPA